MALSNGDFEAGDLTGWSLKVFSDPSKFTETVDATAKHSGSYGWHCNGVISSGNDQLSDISRYQAVDLTGVNSVSYWLNFSGTYTGDGAAYADCYIYDIPDESIQLGHGTGDNGFTSGWTKITIDTTTLTGNCEIQFRNVVYNETGGTINAQIYIDDVVLSYGSLPPVASFTADVSSGEPPLTVTFTDTSTNTPTAWSWDFDDGTSPSIEQNPEHEFTDAGTYHVVLTAENSGGTDASDPVTITVAESLPVANFTYAIIGDQVKFTDTSTDATSWLWDFGDGTSSTEQNPTHRYPKSGGG